MAQDDQILFDHALFITLISTRFQEFIVNYINKYTFLSQLKDDKSNIS